MKEKSKEKLLKKINKIRESFDLEYQKFGWVKDRRGMRYLPSEMYIKIEEYSEGLIYMNWFNKNFPKDKGFPEFLYEWAVILYKNDKIKDARQKVFQTFCSNIYIFDKYFGNDIIKKDIFEKNDTESYENLKFIHLNAGNTSLGDFDEWLKELVNSEKFIEVCEKFIDIRKQLKVAESAEVRNRLNRQEQNLIYEL